MSWEWFSWFFEMPQLVGTIIGLICIYCNLGWRFAEYKLHIGGDLNFRIHSPVLYHLLWPIATTELYPCIPTINERANMVTHGLITEDINAHKFLTMIFFVPGLLLNVFFSLLLWCIWTTTWGQFKPIHPELWKPNKKQ